ncbi:MAG: ABC transporter permease [Pseudomonadota bacterium]
MALPNPKSWPILDRINLIWVHLWLGFTAKTPRENMKLVWVFLEPAGQLLILLTLFSLIGRVPAYGRSFALFLFTGLVFLNFFTRGSVAVSLAIERANSPRRLPEVGLFQPAIAALLMHMLIAAAVAPTLGYAIWYFQQVPVAPLQVWPLFQVILWGSLLVFGVGLVRGYCLRFMPAVERVFKTISRGLFLFSGIFYVPSWLPPEYRWAIAYNPIVHVIELGRTAIYLKYPTTVLSMPYLVGWALGSTVFGMALVWAARARLRE